MSTKPALDSYIEVPDRIQRFYEKYPEGSLQGDWRVEEIGDQTLIIYTACAYRTPEDRRPGIGTASEPFPGKTPYTRGSELMNAETSAWGRAIVSLGFLAKDEKVASKEEVALAQERSTPDVHDGKSFEKKLADNVAALPGSTELATKTQLTKLVKAKEALGPTRFETVLRSHGVDKAEDLPKESAEAVLEWARAQVAKKKAA